ncbi:MAG: hypothetical protein AAGK78_12765, partial [Planctomycetota bacterium]
MTNTALPDDLFAPRIRPSDSTETMEALEPRRLLSTSFTDQQLLAAAQAFPAMPRDTADLIPFTSGLPTFTAGTPFNDLGITLL